MQFENYVSEFYTLLRMVSVLLNHPKMYNVKILSKKRDNLKLNLVIQKVCLPCLETESLQAIQCFIVLENEVSRKRGIFRSNLKLNLAIARIFSFYWLFKVSRMYHKS